MRTTQCANCCGNAEIIYYCKDDPLLFCHDCGTYVLTIEMQEKRDQMIIYTHALILEMCRETARLQQTIIGRLRLRFRLMFGWRYPGIENILKMDARTAKFVDYIYREKTSA